MSPLGIEDVERIVKTGRVGISVGQTQYKCSVESSVTKNGSMRHKETFYAS